MIHDAIDLPLRKVKAAGESRWYAFSLFDQQIWRKRRPRECLYFTFLSEVGKPFM